MNRSNYPDSLRRAALPVLLAGSLLSACGGDDGDAAVSSADPQVYQKTLSDCGIDEPTGANTAFGSLQWDTEYRWSPQYYEVNSVVSAGGAPANASTPVSLQVAILTSGYIEPAWRMGIGFTAHGPVIKKFLSLQKATWPWLT